MSSSDQGWGYGSRAASIPPFIRPVAFFVVFLAFVLLATLNSAGYRYGASDQAFYAPAILERADPSLYPRDSELIRSQARLTLVDDVIGPVARATGVGLPAIFVVLQILSLALLASAALAIARVLYRHQWSAVGLLAALTLRHAISKSGTNTLEGYFHPRQLAFAIGALAIASFLRGRPGTTWLLVALASALHPTTALWFAIWLGVATIVGERRLRVPMIAGVAIAALAGAWGFYAGPLAGRLVVMDRVWLETLASKDYLFPLRWPSAAWLVNLGYIPLIVWIYRRRRADGLLVPRETALVAGCLSLVLVFGATLPFNAMRVALAIQLQPARIFWMLDLLAVVYVVWGAAEGRGARSTRGVIADARRARLVALLIALVSAARGAYIMLVEFPDRRVAEVTVPDDDWGRAMAWARASEPGSGWLANPDHAARYGTSVRVAAERDVYVEAIKDGAVGMYDRAVAIRTRNRVEALGDFMTLTPEHARVIARQYDLDYLVTEGRLDLPLAFSSGAIRVYRLK
jgi:hypothetical protein